MLNDPKDRHARPIPVVWLIRFLRIIIFPWGIWTLCGAVSRRIFFQFFLFEPQRTHWSRGFAVALFLFVGLPFSIVVTGEILIRLNDWVVGEQPSYPLIHEVRRLPPTQFIIDIPGPKSVDPAPVSPKDRKAYYQYLIERYSPVIVQKTSYRPEWDIPIFLDFDENLNPRDNVENEPIFRPHDAGIHAEVTAETEDSYYILYSLYHVKDYDHPVRQALSHWTYHDNDNEGFMIRVAKKTMTVEEAETWFHNRFFLANRTGFSFGPEPVQGRLFFENDHHLIVHVQTMGHGVNSFQPFDLPGLREDVKILRWRGGRPAVAVNADRKVQVDATYDFRSFENWYQFARGPLGSRGKGRGMFEEEIEVPHRGYAGAPLVVGRYIGGFDYAKKSWARPKPPWSWDDQWDNIPIAIWHFLPSRAFESHFGIPLSQDYVTNQPLTSIFGMTASEFQSITKLSAPRRADEKWKMTREDHKVTHDEYWIVLRMAFMKYVNRLFQSLG